MSEKNVSRRIAAGNENADSQSTGLWNHSNFLMLWCARTTSVFGSQLASMAYSLIVILILQASPFQIGLLNAASSVSLTLVALFAGAVVDRISRKPLLIFTNLARFLLSISTITAYLFGVLRIEFLYVITFLSSAFMIISEIAGMAVLQSLLDKEQLVEGNSKLAVTDSAAAMVGPGLSGALVQILTAPVVILVDAISFAVSAFFVWRIHLPENECSAQESRQSIFIEIGAGLRLVFGNALLRLLLQALILHFLFTIIISTAFTLYAIRELQLSMFMISLIFSAMGSGFLLGSIVTRRITVKFGLSHTIIGAVLLNAFAVFFIPVISGSPVYVTIILMTAHFFWACGMQIFIVNVVSLRQAITPNHLQGRMIASFKFLNACALTLGALTVGILGEKLGLRTTLIIGACGMFLPVLRLFFSPIRNLAEHSTKNSYADSANF